MGAVPYLPSHQKGGEGFPPPTERLFNCPMRSTTCALEGNLKLIPSASWRFIDILENVINRLLLKVSVINHLKVLNVSDQCTAPC